MWVEKLDKRTQKSKTFYDEDTKKYKAEFTIHDRHFKNDNNQWEDVDETLIDDTGDFNKKCNKTRHIFQIASGGNRRWYPRRNVQTEYADITGLQYWDNNQWRNLNLPAAVWKSQGAEWDLSFLYASITNTWKKIKTDFVMKNITCPNRLRFQLGLTGLTYNHTTGELTSTSDGLVWGFIQKPIAHDADNIKIPVTATYDSTYIEWTVDITGASYPIYIDPSFVDGYGGDVSTSRDTAICFHYQQGTYGDYNDFELIYAQQNVGLIEFDLSSISSTATCTSATLSFYVIYSDTENVTFTFNELKSANSDWVETATEEPATSGGPTWDFKKDYNGSGDVAWAGSEGASTSGTDYNASTLGTLYYPSSTSIGTKLTSSFDITAVQGWFGASNTNYGVRFYQDYVSPDFATSDHTTTGYRPKLEVEYEEANIIGSTVWGHTTGAIEHNIRTFSDNWTGSGSIVNSGDSEKLILSSTGSYMESEIVYTDAIKVDLMQNKYGSGDTSLLKHRSGSDVASCQEASWQTYSGSFVSDGYVQIRTEYNI